MAGHFNWSHKANARLISSSIGTEEWYAEAEHDGYVKRFGAIHSRFLRVTPARGFVIEDRLVGGQPHHVDIGFLLHPALTAHMQGQWIEVRKDSRLLLRLRHEGPLAAQLHAADSDACGWYSPTFGEKELAGRIVFSGTLSPGQKAVTHFTWAAQS